MMSPYPAGLDQDVGELLLDLSGHVVDADLVAVVQHHDVRSGFGSFYGLCDTLTLNLNHIFVNKISLFNVAIEELL